MPGQFYFAELELFVERSGDSTYSLGDSSCRLSSLMVPMTVAGFFRGRPTARRLFSAVNEAIAGAGPSTMRVTKSQIAFRRKRGFAWAWTPDRWLRADAVAPLVLSIALPRRVRSRRWKEVIEPQPRRFMHHLEIYDVGDVDEEVRAWLQEAWANAA